MTPEKFEQLVKNRLERCDQVLNAKGKEYSRDNDRLWNFKRAAARLGISPARALLGMKVKHEVSIHDIVDDLDRGVIPSLEVVAEKIGDDINYTLLLEGLFEEMRSASVFSTVQDPDAEWDPIQEEEHPVVRIEDLGRIVSDRKSIALDGANS